MMLRFGMPTLIETATIEECAALCREAGLSFIEMNMNLPQYQIQTMDGAYLGRGAKDYGISYTYPRGRYTIAPTELSCVADKYYR